LEDLLGYIRSYLVLGKSIGVAERVVYKAMLTCVTLFAPEFELCASRTVMTVWREGGEYGYLKGATYQ
jgi:hypothetical protein